MTLGISNSIASLICVKLVKYFPTYVFIVIGAMLHSIVFCFIGLWERAASYPAVYIGAVIWGFGNAIWNIIVTSKHQNIKFTYYYLFYRFGWHIVQKEARVCL